MASSAASTAQSAAESAAATDASNKRNEMAQKMGYASYDAMVTAASQGKTIIDGGYLRTSLIEVEDLLAKNITLQAEGYMQSSNYAEDTAGTPTAGFKIDAANNLIKSYAMQANGGTYKNITAKDIILEHSVRFNNLIVITETTTTPVTELYNRLFNFYSSFPKQEALYNTYVINGQLAVSRWNNTEVVMLCYLSITAIELIWTGQSLTGIILRGSGFYQETGYLTSSFASNIQLSNNKIYITIPTTTGSMQREILNTDSMTAQIHN